ncbi:craniofacial development protein 2-like [Penaeus monodon]|uniref:craniofacial development protein 2-like n=1 Tax=Penaeus monodon TaxID=6687 RepID=UPI0018A7775F|nr:craniofacial development protein 2-like [Penaeus monodon]
MVEPRNKGSKRLMTIRLHTSEGFVALVSAYAPTLTSTAEAKDEFYVNISNVIKKIPPKEHVIILGDFNARVGADHDSWPSCLGCFGVGKINENGSSHNTRCYGVIPAQSIGISWTRSDLMYQHQVCAHHPHSTDCDTDHSLVCSKIRLHPKKLYSSKQKSKPRINTTSMQLPEKVEEFAKSLQEAPSVEHQCCSASGRPFRKQPLDLWEKDLEEQRLCAALTEYKRSPGEKSPQAFRAARNKMQQTARRCVNEQWQQLSASIQSAGLGPTQSKTTHSRPQWGGDHDNGKR